MSHPLRVASSNPISDADDKVIGKCSNNNNLPKTTSLSLFKSLFQKTAVNQRIRRTHGNIQTTDSNTLIQPNEVPNRRTACEEDMMDVDEDDRNILETKQVAKQNNAQGAPGNVPKRHLQFYTLERVIHGENLILLSAEH